jgi:hypothetical protein
MTKRFPILKLFALSWTVYRQNGYQLVRAHRAAAKKSSAAQLSKMVHLPKDERNMLQEDWDRAEDILQLVKGLSIKSMERDRGLSAFETRLIKMIQDDYVELGSEQVNAAAALPEMLQTQSMNDRWYKIERSLADTSNFVGDPQMFASINFCVTPQFLQRVRNGYHGQSTFVAGVTEQGDVVKFYLYDSQTKDIKIGQPINLRGTVKRHTVGQTGVRQTYFRQVHTIINTY